MCAITNIQTHLLQLKQPECTIISSIPPLTSASALTIYNVVTFRTSKQNETTMGIKFLLNEGTYMYTCAVDSGFLFQDPRNYQLTHAFI